MCRRPIVVKALRRKKFNYQGLFRSKVVAFGLQGRLKNPCYFSSFTSHRELSVDKNLEEKNGSESGKVLVTPTQASTISRWGKTRGRADPASPLCRFEFPASAVSTAADIEENEGQKSVRNNFNKGKVHNK